MGSEKGLTLLGGETFVSRILRAMSAVVDDCVISVGIGKSRPYREAFGLDCETIEDRTPELGPIGGIISVLESSSSDLVLFSPCDTPFLSPSVCRLVVDEAEHADGAVPTTGEGYYEPLHGAYRREIALEAFRETADSGVLSPQRAFDLMDIRFVSEKRLREVDPELLSFWNMNSPDDLAKAIPMLARG